LSTYFVKIDAALKVGHKVFRIIRASDAHVLSLAFPYRDLERHEGVIQFSERLQHSPVGAHRQETDGTQILALLEGGDG